jgi:hypothetical protein
LSQRSSPVHASARVYVSISDASHRARVRAALAQLRTEVVDVGAVSSLAERDAFLTVPCVLIVDSTVVNRDGRALLTLRRQEPLVGIVLAMLPDDPLHRHLPTLARAAIDSFVTLGSTTDEALLRLEVLARLKHALPHAVLSLFDRVYSRVHLEESWCARNAFRPITVHALASHCRLNRRTVYRDAVTHGWPDVEHLVDASRLLHVAVWLEASQLSIEGIAGELEFSSARAVRKLVVRFTKVTSSDLRRSGAIDAAFRVWKARGWLDNSPAEPGTQNE